MTDIKTLFEQYKQEAEARREAEEAKDNALPWIERKRWRRRDMYKGWMLEDILEQIGEYAAIVSVR